MRCEVALVMICYNAKLQTEINKRLWKRSTNMISLGLVTKGDGAGGGGGGKGRDNVVLKKIIRQLTTGKGGRGGLNPSPNSLLLRRN